MNTVFSMALRLTFLYIIVMLFLHSNSFINFIYFWSEDYISYTFRFIFLLMQILHCDLEQEYQKQLCDPRQFAEWRTSLMSLSLLFQQCTACIVCLNWICLIGGKWSYNYYFVSAASSICSKRLVFSHLAFSPSVLLKSRWCRGATVLSQ